MRKPDRFIGFIEMEGKNVPYEFDADAFKLKLYYPTPDEAREHIFDGFLSFDQSSEKKHEWIPSDNFIASLAGGNTVIFNVRNSPASFCGYKTYDVNWYYLYSGDKVQADGIRICGREINYFYPPQNALKSSITFSEDRRKITEMEVHSNGASEIECGSFTINGHEIHVSGAAVATFHHQSSTPMDAKSYLYAESMSSFDLETAIRLVWVLKSFIMYVTYRSNVVFDTIDVFERNEEGLRNYIGVLAFPQEENDESHEKAAERIIGYNKLTEKSALLMKTIQDNQLSFQHLCKSIDDRRHYPSSRIIMLLSAFEREFRNIYGQDVGRSEDYTQLKIEVISCLEQMRSGEHGNRRKYMKQIINLVENSDNNYGENVKKALLDCIDVMAPFINIRYDGQIEELISDIASRMNILRNGIAHSRLDLEIEAIHLADIRIIEELLYAIRMKSMGFDALLIKRAINDLFHENFAFEK